MYFFSFQICKIPHHQRELNLGLITRNAENMQRIRNQRENYIALHFHKHLLSLACMTCRSCKRGTLPLYPKKYQCKVRSSNVRKTSGSWFCIATTARIIFRRSNITYENLAYNSYTSSKIFR